MALTICWNKGWKYKCKIVGFQNDNNRLKFRNSREFWMKIVGFDNGKWQEVVIKDKKNNIMCEKRHGQLKWIEKMKYWLNFWLAATNWNLFLSDSSRDWLNILLSLVFLLIRISLYQWLLFISSFRNARMKPKFYHIVFQKLDLLLHFCVKFCMLCYGCLNWIFCQHLFHFSLYLNKCLLQMFQFSFFVIF